MWSGALGSRYDSGARGPGFDSHPDPDGFFGNLLWFLPPDESVRFAFKEYPLFNYLINLPNFIAVSNH
jgi:hypothetical protein